MGHLFDNIDVPLRFFERKIMARYCFWVGLLLLANFANAEEHTIRGTQWGMSRSEVMDIEQWEYISKDESHLYYYGELVKGRKTKLWT